MAIDVNERPTERVERINPTATPKLGTGDDAAVRNAADRVDAVRVAQAIGGPDDQYKRVDAPTTSGLPTGWFAGQSSPVDSSQVVQQMGKLGALGNGAAQRFDPSKYSGVVPRDPGAPFTGSGATGVNPVNTSIPAGDLIAMARFDRAEKDIKTLTERRERLEDTRNSARPELTAEQRARHDQILDHSIDRLTRDIAGHRAIRDHLAPTVDKYRNPLSATGNSDPKALWTEQQREQQAKLLLEQPISTIHGDAYGDKRPTRAEVIDAAAKKYNLDPAVLSGFLLHEQRDQSAKEDAADFGGAVLGGRDTSIGPGQVLMSTAMKNNADILSDTVDPKSRASLSRGEVARLLASDEHNIFATARYLRQTADKAATAGPLPETAREFPGFDPRGYATPNWSDANIKALASEYTSKPWDDRVIPSWGYPEDVLTAVDDVRRAGTFRRP